MTAKMRPFRRVVTFALLCVACVCGASTTFELTRVDGTPIFAFLHPDVMDETVDHIEPAQVLARYDAPHMFSPRSDKVANFGFSAGAVWLHIRLQWNGSGPAERVIVVENPLLQRADFYLRHADGQIETIAQSEGDGAPHARMELPAADAVSDLFVRVKSQHSLALPLTLYTPDAYAGHREWKRMQTGLIAGALITLVIYNLLLGVALRKRTYLWLSLHLFSFGLLLMVVQGYGESAWMKFGGHAPGNLVYAALSFAVFGMFGFASSLMKLYEKARVAAITFTALALIRLVLVLMALLIPGQWLAQLCMAMLLPETVVITLCALVLAIRKSRPAQILLIAWAPLLCVLVADTLLSFGVIAPVGYGTMGLAVGALVGASVLTLASVLRYEGLDERFRSAARASNIDVGVAERTRTLATTMAALNDDNQRLRDANDRDGLTGVFNRRYFDQNIDAALSRSRTSAESFSALVADIDHFKRVNDKAGHLVGDDCIRMVARVLQQSLGKGQPVIRYGGEEFVVLLPGMDVSAALAIAERLRANVASEKVVSRDHSLKLTISIGVATVPPRHRISAASLIRAADTALYTAKDEGRNRVVHSGAITKPVVNPPPRAHRSD